MFSWVLASGMFLEVVEGLEEACVSLYGILFDYFFWTTVDSKDGAVGVGGYGWTWVTGEWCEWMKCWREWRSRRKWGHGKPMKILIEHKSYM